MFVHVLAHFSKWIFHQVEVSLTWVKITPRFLEVIYLSRNFFLSFILCFHLILEQSMVSEKKFLL